MRQYSHITVSYTHLIFSANQAILAANAGATYVSPFLGRLDDISQPGIELIRQISEIFDIYGYDTETVSYTHLDVYKRQA